MTARPRLVLRVELFWGDRRVITRTSAVDDEHVVMPVTEPPAIGTEVRMVISFPKLVEPFEVRGVVNAHHAAGGPGELLAVEVTLGPEAGKRLRGALHPPDPHEIQPRSYRILIVEDNALIRDMFAYGVAKYFREHLDVQVELAPDAVAAWERLGAAYFDLAIIDHYLPTMNGAQLVSRIRRDERLAVLPIVAISVGGNDVREENLAAGADLFLGKPIVLRDLFSTLDRLTCAARTP